MADWIAMTIWGTVAAVGLMFVGYAAYLGVTWVHNLLLRRG